MRNPGEERTKQLEDRREVGEARGSGWLGEPWPDRQDLEAGHQSELVEGDRGSLLFGTVSLVEDQQNGESAQTVSFPRHEHRTRLSTGVDEVGGSSHPRRLKTLPPSFSEHTSELLSFEIVFL